MKYALSNRHVCQGGVGLIYGCGLADVLTMLALLFRTHNSGYILKRVPRGVIVIFY